MSLWLSIENNLWSFEQIPSGGICQKQWTVKNTGHYYGIGKTRVEFSVAKENIKQVRFINRAQLLWL